MADIKIAGRIKAGTADNIAGYASEILFDDEASNKTVKEKLEGKQDTLTFDNVPTEGSNNPVKSGGVYQAIQSIDVSGQISGKADKSEMSVVAGTGANADKTTITLKSGTSATVLTQHQDVSEFLREGEVFGSGGDSAASFNSYADTVWNKQQTLSESQKQQVRENIGITDLETIRSGAAAGATAIQSVSVGTTTTGAAGSSASVTNTGTATAPVLSFTIPQGAQGVKGDTVIMGSEATYTLYNTTGDAVDGAMTQQAVTRELTELGGYEHNTNIAFSNSGSLWNGTPSSSTTNNYTGKIKLADYDKVLYTGLSHGAPVTYWTGDTGGTFVSQLTQVQLVGSETDAIDVDVKAIAPTTATYVQLSTANSTHANPPSVTPSVTCINYTTVKSVVEEMQSASYEDKLLGVGKIISLNIQKGVCVNEYEFEIGKKYEITISVDSALSYGCTVYLRVSPDYNSSGISIGEGLTLLSGETEATVIYTPVSTNYKYFTLWNTDNKRHNTILNVSVKEKSANLLSTLSSLNADMYGSCISTYSLSHTGAGSPSHRGFYDFIVGRKYKIIAQSLSDATSVIGIYIYQDYKYTNGESVIQVGRIAVGERTSEFIYSPVNGSNYTYIGSYCGETHNVSVQVVDITDSLKERVAILENKKVETIIAEGALRKGDGYNFNTTILSGDSFVIEVGDVNAIGSYTISTWSGIDKGGTQVEANNIITQSTTIFTAKQDAACLRLYFNGSNEGANITWFTIKRVVGLQAAFEKTSSHLLPIMPSFPSVLKEGMIWIDMPNRLLVDIDSSLISDVSASFLDKEGNIIDCSSLTKNGDAVSFAQSGSCMSLPNYVLGNNFSIYMKFNLHNTTQTSCYIMLMNYNSDTGDQVSVLYNYSSTSKNIQLYIDGTTYDTISLSDTNVHELLVVYDSGLFSVYLDGETKQSFERVIKTSPTAYNTVGNTLSKTHPCAMDISEFRLYNISISPNDI